MTQKEQSLFQKEVIRSEYISEEEIDRAVKRIISDTRKKRKTNKADKTRY